MFLNIGHRPKQTLHMLNYKLEFEKVELLSHMKILKHMYFNLNL